MGVWQDLTGDNTKHTDAIIEKHETMINNLRVSDMARKIAWKGFICVYCHQLDMNYHHM